MTEIAFFDTKPYDYEPFTHYGEQHGIRFKFFEPKLNKDTANLAMGYDGVCVFVNDDINCQTIDLLKQNGTRFIALRCAGYNNIDVKYAKGKLRIANVPAYSPHSIAEHAMALLLTSVRRIHKAYNRTRDFNFSLNGLTGFDLHGKTVGVIGTGRIGKIFINICKGFGMNVMAYDKYPDTKANINYVGLNELYKQSDIISFHCPLTPETYHMLNRKTLSDLKKGVIIINTSRGALIDSEALLMGITSRNIGAACLDVYEEETDFFFSDRSGHIMDDDTLARLISMPNVIITSHQGFLTEEALDGIAKTTVENIVNLIENNTCVNEIK